MKTAVQAPRERDFSVPEHDPKIHLPFAVDAVGQEYFPTSIVAVTMRDGNYPKIVVGFVKSLNKFDAKGQRYTTSTYNPKPTFKIHMTPIIDVGSRRYGDANTGEVRPVLVKPDMVIRLEFTLEEILKQAEKSE